MTKTLVIVNPHAAGGETGRRWSPQLDALLSRYLGAVDVVLTQSPADVPQHVARAYAEGMIRILSIGGDGTNHSVVNAIIQHQKANPTVNPIPYGNIPQGTGRDWARSRGIPFGMEPALQWIVKTKPRPTDIGLIRYDGQERYFLNIASAGLSGEVDRRVNESLTRRPWTFFTATVQTLFSHNPVEMAIEVDGEAWFHGRSYLLAVANGTTFGHGMKFAPNAQSDDGLFDLVLVRDISRLQALTVLAKVYNGSHLTHSGVMTRQGREINVRGISEELALDLDGEHAVGVDLHYSICPNMLSLIT